MRVRLTDARRKQAFEKMVSGMCELCEVSMV